MSKEKQEPPEKSLSEIVVDMIDTFFRGSSHNPDRTEPQPSEDTWKTLTFREEPILFPLCAKGKIQQNIVKKPS